MSWHAYRVNKTKNISAGIAKVFNKLSQLLATLCIPSSSTLTTLWSELSITYKQPKVPAAPKNSRAKLSFTAIGIEGRLEESPACFDTRSSIFSEFGNLGLLIGAKVLPLNLKAHTYQTHKLINTEHNHQPITYSSGESSSAKPFSITHKFPLRHINYTWHNLLQGNIHLPFRLDPVGCHNSCRLNPITLRRIYPQELLFTIVS